MVSGCQQLRVEIIYIFFLFFPLPCQILVPSKRKVWSIPLPWCCFIYNTRSIDCPVRCRDTGFGMTWRRAFTWRIQLYCPWFAVLMTAWRCGIALRGNPYGAWSVENMCTVCSWQDNTSFFSLTYTISNDMIARANTALTRLKKWIDFNCLKINAKTTITIFFLPISKPFSISTNLYFDCQPIELLSTMKP